MLKHWFTHSAKPWQFWYPQSGIAGGMLFAVTLWGAVVAVAAVQSVVMHLQRMGLL